GSLPFASEELDYAGNFFAHLNGKCESRDQTSPGRERATGKILFGADITDPVSGAGLPNSARKSDATCKRPPTAAFFKLISLNCRHVPDCQPPQRVRLMIHDPHLTEVPAETFANHLEELGRGGAERFRLGQNPRRLVLDGQTLLEPLAICYIARIDDDTGNQRIGEPVTRGNFVNLPKSVLTLKAKFLCQDQLR